MPLSAAHGQGRGLVPLPWYSRLSPALTTRRLKARGSRRWLMPGHFRVCAPPAVPDRQGAYAIGIACLHPGRTGRAGCPGIACLSPQGARQQSSAGETDWLCQLWPARFPFSVVQHGSDQGIERLLAAEGRRAGTNMLASVLSCQGLCPAMAQGAGCEKHLQKSCQNRLQGQICILTGQGNSVF